MSCTATCVHPTPAQAHCGACHTTWSGITLFDRHRKGGDCATPDALIAEGLKIHDVRGVWRYAEPRPDYPRTEATR
jgi:hypothetical protein